MRPPTKMQRLLRSKGNARTCSDSGSIKQTRMGLNPKGILIPLSCTLFGIVVAVSLSSFSSSGGVAAERIVPSQRSEIQLSYAPVVDEVAPAVVNIYTRRRVGRRQASLFDDPFFERFFGFMNTCNNPNRTIDH